MSALWLLIPAALLALLAAAWYGSNIVFTPGHKAPLLTFPEQYELAYEKIEFAAEDGVTLRGWLIPAARRTERTLIVLHGWSDNKGDALARFRFLAQQFNLLLFDSRAHGESDGDFATLGCLEAWDVDAAIAWLREHRPDWTARMGVVGLSMGAVIGIGAMARHPDLRCAVLESPFLSYTDVVRKFCWNNYHLPFFPFAWLTLWVIRKRLGRDPEPYSPLYHADKIAPRPALFIAGEADRLMPLSVVESVYQRVNGPKELWVVTGAGHGLCQETAGPEYAKRVAHFLDSRL